MESLDKLLGPVVVMHHLYIFNELPILLEFVVLDQRRHMCFMHDGAPTYFLSIATQHLNQSFCGQRIGRGKLDNFPARSPDLIL